MTDAELRSLARPMRPATRELQVQNAYYGHDLVLKRFAQVPPNRTLKVAIEHGAVIGGIWFWRVDLHTAMPTFLCATPGRAEQYRDMGGRAAESVAIGPYIRYARPLEEPPPGDRLLFFPPHSTPDVPVEYDLRAVADKLERYRSEWNEVTVCIYWRDVPRVADFYRSLGVECVTAGHFNDPGFLDRLRAIIERCDAVRSIEFGSHVLYALALDRPIRLERQEVEYTREAPPGLIGEQTPAYRDAVARLFRALEGEPSEAELEWIRDLIGFHEYKSPTELLAIFDDAEERYHAMYGRRDQLLHLARARTPERVRRAGSPLYWRLRKLVN